MSRKRVRPWPPTPLAIEATQNNAPALADLIAGAAGNAALMNGYIYGGDTLDGDTPNLVPQNPGGTGRGHDHSGGVWGAPLYRSLATWALGSHHDHVGSLSYLSTQIDIGDLYFTPDADETQRVPVPTLLPFWVPGCDPGPEGAYNRLGWSVQMYCVDADTTSSGDSLEMRIRNRHPDLVGASAPWISLADSTFNATGKKLKVGSQTQLIPAVPGSINVLEVVFRYVADSTSGLRSVELSFAEFEVGVYAF